MRGPDPVLFFDEHEAQRFVESRRRAKVGRTQREQVQSRTGSRRVVQAAAHALARARSRSRARESVGPMLFSGIPTAALISW